MNELTILLFVLGAVLAVVTLVGHGIWVLLSKLFGGERRPASTRAAWPDEPPPQRQICPRCFASLEIGQQVCALCGWPQERREQADSAAVLRAMRRQLEEFAWRGAVDAGMRARMTAVIEEEERRLAREALFSQAAPPAPPAVPIPPVAVAESPPAPAAEAASPSPMPLPERARKYAASRDAAAVEARLDAVAATREVEPPKQREALSRLFAAFMEEKNIRWGELVGGLLIVGCSIALVISFWSEIATRPLLKFVLFNGVTAALFGVGIYTDRRWKIRTTSHGVLAIATLLVPLNFLAIAAFTQAAPPADFVSLVGEAISLAVFAMLVFLAGRILVPNDTVLLVIGVMTACLMQLLVRRFAEQAMPLPWLYALAAAPIASYLGTSMWAARNQWADETQARRVLVFLGLVSAATLMPLALLLYFVPPPRETLHWLSPLVAVCGLPALLVGLLFWRRMTDRRLSGLQTAGIGVGAFGALIMAGAVVLAWPDPATLLPTALATAAAMLIVAIWFAISAAHVPAGLALAAAWLIAFYLFRGHIDWTVADPTAIKGLLLSATSGHVLMPLVALFGGVAWWLRSRNRGDEALMYGIVTAVTAVVSLAVVMWFGFARPGDPHHATVTLAIYALAALAAGVMLDRADVTRIGSALLLAALVQGVVFRYGDAWRLEQPWIVALLAHATLTAVGGGATGAFRSARLGSAIQALIWSAQVTSVAAAAWIVATVPMSSASALGVHMAWLAGVWMLLSMLGSWPALFTASQIAVVLAIFCGVTALVENRTWYMGARHPWLDPWFLEAQGIALAGYCLIVAAFRELLTQSAKRQSQYVIESATPLWRSASERLLNPPWPAIDHVAAVAIVLVLAIVATYAVAPGVAQELSPTETVGARVAPPIERFEIAGVTHAHAGSEGAWMLLAAVALTLTGGLRHAKTHWRLAGMVLAAMAAAALLAARWEAQTAVASALRWLTAGVFAILSTAIWLRTETVLREIRDFLVAMTLSVYVAMGAYACRAALVQANVTPVLGELWAWTIIWALIAGVIAVVTHYSEAAKQRTGSRNAVGLPNAWARHARDILLLLAVVPATVLLTFVVAKALDARPIVGPEPDSWFRQIGLDVSYGVPLAIIALVFIGYAIRDQSSRFALAAGLLFNVVATIVVLLRLARGGGVLDAVAWITVAQVNAAVAGASALVWLAAITWHRRLADRAKPQAPGDAGWPLLLATQVALAAVLCGTYLLPAAVRLAATPAVVVPWLMRAGSPLGWIALALAAVAAGWLDWRRTFYLPVVAYFTAALVAIIALTSLRWDTGNWLAYHTLLVGCTAAAWLVPPLTFAANRSFGSLTANVPVTWSAISVRAFGIAAVVLALRALGGDPAAPAWTVAALGAISARNVWMAWREGGRGSIWIAAVLANIAVSAWWDDAASRLSATRGPGQPVEFLWVNLIAMAVMAVVSVWIERQTSARRIEPARRIAFHRFAVWAIVAVLMMTTAGGLLDDLSGNFFATNNALGWLTWLAGVAAAIACFWDPAIRWPVACLYLYGLVAVGIYLGGLDLETPMFQWALANALAAYSLATSTIWSGRERLREIAVRLGVPMTMWNSFSETGDSERRTSSATWAGGGHAWLVPANLLLGAFVLLLVVWIELAISSFPQRMVAAYSVGAQAFAIGLLARGAVRTPLQYLALVWGVLFAVAFGWAWLPPQFDAPWLHRLVVAVVALAAMVVVYGFGFVKFLRRENEWTRAAARLVPSLAALAAVLILVVLGMETAAFVRDGAVPIAWPALVAVGLALAGLTVGALAAAILPGRDPLGLSERGRTAYVYAAEALIALLCLHIRVTMPWLFHGWFQQFWPLVVMGIAFVGVGFGELFQRRRGHPVAGIAGYRVGVLSEPLQTTGALLPLLPALGFWVMSSELYRVDYSLLLLSVGVLYAALSVLRQSFLYGVLAALAANGSLWYLLSQRDGLSLVEHPQLWLIPPALCALAAGYINRERLTQQQSAALRYAAAIVIYVSSTADVFINGVADAPWLPAVLAGLSILGVLAGILLRVRAFLYLGTAFLVVALMTIIWHAAIHEQRTWILWVAGIVTGALIIALFGLFEKRRDDVLRVVEELKHWHA